MKLFVHFLDAVDTEKSINLFSYTTLLENMKIDFKINRAIIFNYSENAYKTVCDL